MCILEKPYGLQNCILKITEHLGKTRIMTDQSTCKVLSKAVIILIKMLAHLKRYLNLLINIPVNTGVHILKNVKIFIEMWEKVELMNKVAKANAHRCWRAKQ